MGRWGDCGFIYCCCYYFSDDDDSDSKIFRSSSISTPITTATITVMYLLLHLLKSTFIPITTNKKTVTNLYPFYHVVIIIPLYYYCSECYY